MGSTTALGKEEPWQPPPVRVQREGVREHKLAGLGAGAAPGADVRAVAPEVVHARVPVTVGDVDIAAGRVDAYVGGLVESSPEVFSRAARRDTASCVASVKVRDAPG